jgi:uncharacterized protein (DUF983 family)
MVKGRYTDMTTFSELLRRGLLLRCPVCGQGKLFRSAFGMHQQCPVCHFVYEREEGYFTSAIAIDLVVSELIVTAVALPLAANPSISIMTVLLWCIPLSILLPVIFYRHSRGLWMSMDHFLHPTPGSGFASQLPPPEPERPCDGP